MAGNAINGDALASGSLNASPEKLEVTTPEATAASTEASEIELLIKPAAATSKSATSTRGIIKTDVKEVSEINDTVKNSNATALESTTAAGSSVKISILEASETDNVVITPGAGATGFITAAAALTTACSSLKITSSEASDIKVINPACAAKAMPLFTTVGGVVKVNNIHDDLFDTGFSICKDISASRSSVGFNVPFIGTGLGLKQINIRSIDIFPCTVLEDRKLTVCEHSIYLRPEVKYSWGCIKNRLFGYFNRQYPFNNIRFIVWFKTIPNSFLLPYPLEGEAAESILTPLYMLNLTLFRESHLVFKHLNRELIEIDVVVGTWRKFFDMFRVC